MTLRHITSDVKLNTSGNEYYHCYGCDCMLTLDEAEDTECDGSAIDPYWYHEYSDAEKDGYFGLTVRERNLGLK